LQLKPETSNLRPIGQSNLVTAYVIQRAIDYCDHAPVLASVQSRADKDDLISNVEGRHHELGSSGFSEPNDIVVYRGFPNRGEAGVLWTIWKDIAFPHNALFATAHSLIQSKFRIRFPIARHKCPIALLVAVCAPRVGLLPTISPTECVTERT
jgi:hypothetical protein